MGKPKFTEGPWRSSVETTDEGMRVDISNVSVDADDDGRARDYGGSLLESGYLVCETDEENTANVALMVAAPEMYEALERVRRDLTAAGLWTLKPGTPLFHACYGSEAALAYARGEDFRMGEDD